ncbi:MAG: UDP-N-acetylmuramoyl-tripeptide--D-alanyl-D-alanine ligase [bacterium]|jgi:UDP-N-acetylmuramoyl-tripeptide--D-alanyl-D-alanine ligase
MIKMTAAEIAAVTGAAVIAGEAEVTIGGVSNDSRRIKPGDIFFALPGEESDGHLYVPAAFAAGAAAAIVTRPAAVGPLPGGAVVLHVPDAVAAMAALARACLKRISPVVVGVTGSVGKTTTKDMIAAVLSEKYPTLKNEGNLNTEVGLPLTVFRLEEHHRAAVLEMGMRGPGQISYLAGIAQPLVGVITNIGETHIELLGSVENIARAKGELLAALPAGGTAVLNGDDVWCRRIAATFAGNTIFFGTGRSLAVTATNIRSRQERGIAFLAHFGSHSVEMSVPVPGQHNVANALAAVAVGWRLGVEPAAIARGLARFAPSEMRLAVIDAGRFRIINDVYNANPQSMRAALRVLDELAGGRRVAVLGDMLEMGEHARSGHQAVGEFAGQKVDLLVTVGPQAALIAAAARAALPPEAVHSFGTNGAAIDFLRDIVAAGDTVLVKGSRGMQMEEIVACLQKLTA